MPGRPPRKRAAGRRGQPRRQLPGAGRRGRVRGQRRSTSRPSLRLARGRPCAGGGGRLPRRRAVEAARVAQQRLQPAAEVRRRGRGRALPGSPRPRCLAWRLAVLLCRLHGKRGARCPAGKPIRCCGVSSAGASRRRFGRARCRGRPRRTAALLIGRTGGAAAGRWRAGQRCMFGAVCCGQHRQLAPRCACAVRRAERPRVRRQRLCEAHLRRCVGTFNARPCFQGELLCCRIDIAQSGPAAVRQPLPCWRSAPGELRWTGGRHVRQLLSARLCSRIALLRPLLSETARSVRRANLPRHSCLRCQTSHASSWAVSQYTLSSVFCNVDRKQHTHRQTSCCLAVQTES